jgi:hypothetical protein
MVERDSSQYVIKGMGIAAKAYLLSLIFIHNVKELEKTAVKNIAS